MRALLVLDVQKYILGQKDFWEEKDKIKKLIHIFREKGEIVIFTRHIENIKESPFNKNNNSSEIHEEFDNLYDYIIEKTTQSAFYKTNLERVLKAENIDEVIVTGFNTEYCCMFTSIAAFDRGYNVTFIQDASGTVSNGGICGTKDIDIKDFVGSIISLSNTIKVVNYDEFLNK
ncbi:isochorismatase family cysteine hydrolase [Clostridium sp. UBA6640]|uniref:isochorismatase family cysteine hydrolase n=1 Tax=Clostridium sp. UBA6640 TaxID=1946370 RepID=UPI0025BEC5CB|nr:isochorismatase family cysteine hydrolase [Clostridium sp. UBA6640]